MDVSAKMIDRQNSKIQDQNLSHQINFLAPLSFMLITEENQSGFFFAYLSKNVTILCVIQPLELKSEAFKGFQYDTTHSREKSCYGLGEAQFPLQRAPYCHLQTRGLISGLGGRRENETQFTTRTFYCQKILHKFKHAIMESI